MNKIKQTFLLASMLGCIFVNAQKINFQGKVFQNGSPATGSHNFQFYIPTPVNWTETHSNVTVNNGLYSVVLGSITAIPTTLFSQNTEQLLYVKYDGNWIDTLTIFSPFERDYTVPSNIKDGISWSEVSNKPTVDTSNTNEIQTLNLNGNVLSLTNGGQVTLPSGSSGNSGDLTVNGNLTVIDTSLSSMVTLPNTGIQCTHNTNQRIWQSFKATANGRLRQIVINLSSSVNNGVVYIYGGQGGQGNTQILGQKTITGLSSTQQNYTIDLSTGITPIVLTTSNTYTFEIAPGSGGTLTPKCITTNPYVNGMTDYGANTDYSFSVNIDNSTPSCLTFNNSCYVGIGTDNPSSQLEVRGRIKDQTGFLMPVGTIISFGGRNIPDGWLLCDGSTKSRLQYADLFAALDSSWGAGDHNATFNLPDLRGRFLRGMDGSAGNDPDAATRTASNAGGNVGNNVGSLQNDALQFHKHLVSHNTHDNSGDSPGGGGTYTATTAYVQVGATAGTTFPMISGPPLNNADNADGSVNNYGKTRTASESRPKNANVIYIIKY